MTVTSLIENTSAVGLPVEHGLSLYVQLDDGRNILFDMGQGSLFARNAQRLGLSIADVDVAFVSHGHYDHGGGLRTFLTLNSKAKVCIHRDAFQPHYSFRETSLAYIGLDKDLADSNRLAVCDDVTRLAGGLTLFSDVRGDCCRPVGNRLLFGPGQTERDAFTHEQNLIIEEGGNTVLFAGCAHNGIINIMRRAEQVMGKSPTHVLAGMHLVKSGLSAPDEDAFIASLSHELMSFPSCQYHTMHCTGTEQYQKMKAFMDRQIAYLSCGESVTL